MPGAAIAPTELTFAFRILVAGILAGTLGWEREYAKKPAGLRTHIAVGIGAALFTSLGEIIFLRTSDETTGWRSDPMRIVQAIAVGIGFLGSGLIFVSGSAQDRHVQGLTTAASIWATAAIGMAAALGLYILAISATLLLLLVLRVLVRLDAPDHS